MSREVGLASLGLGRLLCFADRLSRPRRDALRRAERWHTVSYAGRGSLSGADQLDCAAQHRGHPRSREALAPEARPAMCLSAVVRCAAELRVRGGARCAYDFPRLSGTSEQGVFDFVGSTWFDDAFLFVCTSAAALELFAIPSARDTRVPVRPESSM